MQVRTLLLARIDKTFQKKFYYRKCLVPQASAHSSPQDVHDMAESADANIMQPIK